jgi:ribonucleoside-diphosphate reductase alpha chain
MKFEPSGMTNDPDIRFASSLVDYVFRRLALDHLPKDTRQELGIRSIAERKETVAQDVAAKMADELGEAASDIVSAAPVDDPLDPSPTRIELVEGPKTQAADAPLCYTCGSKMQPAGSCYVCPSCGSTSGCS